MKILFAASEAAPFAKTGGLADVAGSLPLALAALGHDVRLVLPRYRRIDPQAYNLKKVASLSVPVGAWKENCDILEGKLGRKVTVYFVDKNSYYDRPELYQTAYADYPDNAERFVFFSRALPELCRAVGFTPHIIHCNDWQTGLVPLYLKTLYRDDDLLRKTRSVFTIHNLGYQGLFWHWDMALTGLGWDFFTPEGIEFWGRINFLKAGLVSADIITTVSKTYSREIQSVEYGHGLEGVLAKRAADLYGIVNGIDHAAWNPSRDSALPKTFSAARPAGRKVCRQTLLSQLRLPESEEPVIGMVTRLADQKGLDILTGALPELMKLGLRLVVLGTGDERYHRYLTQAERRYPKQIRALFKHDEALARIIYAGCDIFLMPSRYEPCGLSQMNALRYGAVPVVRKTGGLADTIKNFNQKKGTGTGFVFEDYSSHALIDCLHRAVQVYNDAKTWKSLIRTCMEQDFSWEHSAKEYEKVYRKAMKK